MTYPINASGTRHFCYDETATVVNDHWICKCGNSPRPMGFPKEQRRIALESSEPFFDEYETEKGNSRET